MIEKSHAQKNTEEVMRPAHSSVDEVIVFKQLRDKTSLGIMIDIDDNTAIKQATGSIVQYTFLYIEYDKEISFNEKLEKVHQLTGFSDPVYCEAVVYMKDFDIVRFLV